MNNTDLEQRITRLEKMHVWGSVAIVVLLFAYIIKKQIKQFIMELKEMYEDLKKDNADIVKKLRVIRLENDIQTIAVVLVFLFGITTLSDVASAVKKAK